ncbi:MAG: hypothetical protein ACJAU0_001621, partial [Flavobacteriales bacterium]
MRRNLTLSLLALVLLSVNCAAQSSWGQLKSTLSQSEQFKASELEDA